MTDVLRIVEHVVDPLSPPAPTFDVLQAVRGTRQALADSGHFPRIGGRWTSTKNTRPDQAEPSTAALTSEPIPSPFWPARFADRARAERASVSAHYLQTGPSSESIGCGKQPFDC